MVDKAKRVQLIAAIKALAKLPSTQRVLIPISQFFDGNDDQGSIGCNLSKHPGLRAFHKLLGRIQLMEEVAGVYLAITEVDETYDTIWPFTDTALIATRLAPSAFESILGPLAPDSISRSEESFANPPSMPEGYHLVSVWWD